MSENKTQSGKHQKQPFDTKHLSHSDDAGDNPLDIPAVNPAGQVTDAAPDHLSVAEQEQDQNQLTEQKLKQQQRQQDERSDFQQGNAQTHQQGNRQR